MRSRRPWCLLPVAIMTLMVLHYIADADTASDINAEVTTTATARVNQRLGPAQLTRRPRSGIERYFTGLELIDPGLVPLNRWRPEPDDPAFPRDLPTYCGAARKP